MWNSHTFSLAAATSLWIGLLACASTPAGTRLEENQVLRSEEGGFEFTVPAGWQSLPAGTLDEEPAEFELARIDDEAHIVTRSKNVTSLNLDELVSPRRELLTAGGGVDFEERRFLLPNSPATPASLARYRLGASVWLILSASQPPVGVELIGAVNHGSGHETEVLDILMSVTFEPSPSQATARKIDEATR